MNPDIELAGGRALMGDSLGFHIIFALLGVGLPLLVSLFEFLGIVRKDSALYATARRWTFAMGALAVVGVISGTIISFQMNLLWPTFMEFMGQANGLPFFLEGYAFLIEAVFLAVYVFSWDRFGKWMHWLCSLPIVLGSVATAFFITTANAFMNNPQGFTYEGGVLNNLDPWKAMFNPATFSETTHSITSYYLTTAFALAAIYAFLLLKKHVRENTALSAHYRKVLGILLVVGFVFGLLIGATGDHSAKYIAEEEPIKFAAAEAHFETQGNAPLKVGGLLIAGQWQYVIEIPGMLSLLAFGDPNAVVKGLNEFDPTLWPPLYIHYFFDLMVGIGFFLIAVPVLYFFVRRWTRLGALSSFVLWLIVLAGPLAFFAVEFGWMLTEIGRQPWVIRGIMKTAEAFTTNSGVLKYAFIFPTLYVVLFVVIYKVLRRHYKEPMDLTKQYFFETPPK